MIALASKLLTGASDFWARSGAEVIKWVLVGVVAVGIFFGGYQYRKESELKNAQIATTQIVKVQNNEIARRDAQTVYVYREDLEKVRQLEADKAALQTKLDHLKDMVTLYVPKDNVGSYISPCAVSLLNDAAHGVDSTVAANSSPALAACADTGASALTWQQFVQREIEVRGKYNDARAQGNALIQWVEDHVVNANTDKDPSNQPSMTAPSN